MDWMWGLRKMVFKMTHRVTVFKQVTNVALAKMGKPGGRKDLGVRVFGFRRINLERPQVSSWICESVAQRKGHEPESSKDGTLHGGSM